MLQNYNTSIQFVLIDKSSKILLMPIVQGY